jgi:hypothetical protein
MKHSKHQDDCSCSEPMFDLPSWDYMDVVLDKSVVQSKRLGLVRSQLTISDFFRYADDDYIQGRRSVDLCTGVWLHVGSDESL